MSDVAYIMETQDPRELWLVEGENKFKVSSDMYWLLASKGADLPPTHHITELLAENAKLRELMYERAHVYAIQNMTEDELRITATNVMEDNAKLREQIERLQPKDCEGNVLDIADTVSMLRSEYDGDHEWDDVVVELSLTKWGGDRWIVRGSKGEAWACDCVKTGYDEDAYEGSDDVETIDNPVLIEAENAKLRTQLTDVTESVGRMEERCAKLRELVRDIYIDMWNHGEWLEPYEQRMRELGIEVE